MSIVFVIIGAVLVLWGADRLTDGATALAVKLNIPQIVIGLTVVAFGTSMPEFFVSMTSAVKGTSDMALGNIVGSNIFNTLMIVGVSAAVAPMIISRNTVRKDMLFAMVAALMLMVMCLDNELSRIDAVLLFIVFIIFMVYTLRMAKEKNEEEETQLKTMNGWLAAGLMLLGLACLIIGSNLFVDGASKIAKSLGVSDAVIGLTIVACGTSLPELATSVVAAKKGRAAIAIGNVIGSNVLNILMIVGITGMIIPMDLHGITWIDMTVMTVGMMILWGFSYTKFKIERWEGFVLTFFFVAYMCWLIYSAVR
ncbi:MAG: calcium/sodium antiporter [Prevotella sp.]|nr:calcium/sodium antiporter [Prevotella sp.]